MTLSLRNNFLKGGIILAALSLTLVVAGGYFAFPAYPEALSSAATRSGGIIEGLIKDISGPSAQVPFWSIFCAVVYSLISVILIYYYFEKTQSPEIFFFALFAVSLSLEFTRIAIPLIIIYPYPTMYLLASSRVLLFGRYFGLFALFSSGIHAAGFDGQKQQTVFLLSILASMVISFNVPLDSLVWDSTFALLSGYGAMFAFIEAAIISVTIISFFISSYTRGSKNYLFSGLGILLAFLGRYILLGSDTWITPLPGLIILSVGTWLVCSSLHREYLWQ